MAKLRGTVFTKITLTRPDHVIEREEPVQFDTDEQLMAYVLMQVAKVRAEGGIMELPNPFRAKLIPIERVVDVEVWGEKSLIQTDGNVNQAAVEADTADRRNNLLHFGK